MPADRQPELIIADNPTKMKAVSYVTTTKAYPSNQKAFGHDRVCICRCEGFTT